MRVLLAIFTVALPGYGAAAPDLDTNRLVERAEQLELSKSAMWRRLLHFPVDEGPSESLIRTSNFFISPDGHTSPRAELTAMLIGLDFTADAPGNDSLRCKYPARYLWLSTQLSLPGFDPAKQCPHFSAWARMDQVESVSLMLISGYFGNPASTFGHALMKIDNGKFESQHSLHDLGINYGALVPQDEATLAYIVKGLLGGYQAGFSDQDYYRYDQTYSRTEFRDMWEYELDLTEFQKKLLIYHLWEIAGKKFTYFFLKENCAYRLAELLELLSGDDYVADVDAWYTPVSLFQRLHELDEQKAPGKKLIGSIRFIPSSQRVLYTKLEELSEYEIDVLNQVILNPDAELSQSLSGLTEPQRMLVLDTLLAYYEYRLTGKDIDQERNLRRAKDRAIALRLSAPPSEPDFEVGIVQRRSPASGAAPSIVAVGFAHDEIVGSQMAFRYSPFRYDRIGNNVLNGSELIVLDVSVLLDGVSDLSLDRIDVVRARKLNLNAVAIAGESQQSWEIALGVQREANDCRNCNEIFFEGKVGRAASLGDQWIATAFIGGAITSGELPLRAQTGLSVILTSGARWETALDAAYVYGVLEDKGYTQLALSSRFSLAQQHEIRIELDRHRGVAGKIYYAYHW